MPKKEPKLSETWLGRLFYAIPMSLPIALAGWYIISIISNILRNADFSLFWLFSIFTILPLTMIVLTVWIYTQLKIGGKAAHQVKMIALVALLFDFVIKVLLMWR